MNFEKLLRAPILKNICERLVLIAAEEPRRNRTAEICYFYLVLFTLTSLKLVLFPSFIYDLFIHICFGFETKLVNRKLSEELRPVLKYKLKERD